MKVEVNRHDEMPKAGDLVIDELGKYWHPNAQWLYLVS